MGRRAGERTRGVFMLIAITQQKQKKWLPFGLLHTQHVSVRF